MDPSWLLLADGRAGRPPRPDDAPPAASPSTAADGPPAADLSRERLTAPFRALPLGRGLDWLQVLVLAGAPLGAEGLGLALSQCVCLRQLDVSHCRLAALPPADAWAGLRFLAALFLHRNHLAQWVDVERAAAGPPRLEWLTLFENPIASQPEFRGLVIRLAPRILAVDLWVITDDERLPPEPSEPGSSQPPSRFTAFSRESTLNMRTQLSEQPGSPAVLFREARRQLQQVHYKSRHCSAAYTMQCAWKLHHFQSCRRAEAEKRVRATRQIQRHFRRLLWKKGLTRYLKGYLAEIDELDLMLSAKEMLTLRASKRIEATVKRWVQQRKERRKLRMAELLLLRWSRGHLLRVAVQRREFQLETYHRVYVPARYAWEFLALVNAARQDCRLPRLPPTFTFEVSPFFGVRVPEASDLPRRRASIMKLLVRRSNCIVRPCYSGRFPEHVWDGPFHRLVDQCSDPRIGRAYAKIRRRAAHVDNRCRRVFLQSCAPGQHPIERGRPSHRNSDTSGETDFRDEFVFGTQLGESALGTTFECRRRLAGDGRQRPAVGTRAQAAKLVEHCQGWWGRLRGGKRARLLALAGDLERLRGLQHACLARLKAVYLDEHFVYFVTDRFEANLASLVHADRRFGKRGLQGCIIGEIIQQALRSVAYLHSKGVAHRNVKAENFLLDRYPSVGRPFKVMLSDLAAARFLDAGVYLKDTVGSPEYWAPEVVSRAYAHAADVWAVGVMLWLLLTGKFPFASPSDACAGAFTREIPSSVSRGQLELAQGLLTKDQEHRPAAAVAQQDDWLQAAAQELRKASMEAANAEEPRPRSRGPPHARLAEAHQGFAEREEKLRIAEEQYLLGERLTLSLERVAERARSEELGVDGEGESVDACEWWSSDLCLQRGLSLPQDTCQEPEACCCWPGTLECLQALIADAGGSIGSAAELQRELESGECCLQMQSGRLVRIVHSLVLRVASPGGRILIGSHLDTNGCRLLRLPSGDCRAIGSGFRNLWQEVSRIIESELQLSSHILHVYLSNWQHNIMSETSELEKYPGLRDVCERHVLEAVVSPEASRAQLDAIGLPGDQSFEVTLPDGTEICWEWLDVADSEATDLPAEATVQFRREACGYLPLRPDSLTRAGLEQALQRDGVDTRRFGVGKAHSLQQITRDVNAGQARLCEQCSGGLVRLVDVLTVRVRSSLGLYLVRSRRRFGREEQEASDSHPEVRLRPFEDGTWAIRHLLCQWDIPFADATVSFGPVRAEPAAEEPAYPGIPVVHLRRTADVEVRSAGWCEGEAAEPWRWIAPLPEGMEVEARAEAGAENAKDAPVSLALQELLEGPEPVLPDVSLEARTALRKFLQEARRLGSRPREPEREAAGMLAVHGAVKHHETGLPVYRDTTWLGERLLCYDCGSLRLAETLMSLLLRFEGTGGDAPLINPVPMLLERSVHEISAATCIQSAYRAHRARCALPCSLLKAATMRRAVLCIQRSWRWSLLRRRFDLLEGAAAAANAVKSATLYIEERLLRALNLVNGVDRCAPLLRERGLGFGYSAEEDDVVLVRGDLRGRRGSGSEASSAEGRREERRRRAGKREGGLPSWFWNVAGSPAALGPDDPDLVPVCGLQGLLLQGLMEPVSVQSPQPAEGGHVVTVSVQSLQYASQTGVRGEASPALASSGGQLKFVELRFRSTAQAKRRALVLFLCTYSSPHRAAVPLVPKAALHSTQVCRGLVRLWDAYGLAWEASDRTAVFQLQRRFNKCLEVVPLAGREPWQSVARREWLAATGPAGSTAGAGGGSGRGAAGGALPPIGGRAEALQPKPPTPPDAAGVSAAYPPVLPRSARSGRACGSAAAAARELTPRTTARRRLAMTRGAAVGGRGRYPGA